MALAPAACSLVFPISDDAASGGTPDDGGEASALQSADAQGDSALDAPRALRCAQTGRGPDLVPAGDRLCIDAHEVTQAEYAAFVAAGLDAAASPVPFCTSNETFEVGVTGDGGDVPVDNVEWCDAFAFCAWAGKALCGTFPGQSIDRDAGAGVDAGFVHGILPADVAKRSVSAWEFACQGGDEARFYPYGNDLEADACSPVLRPVGGTSCQGGFPGLSDMIGNGREWVDSCMNAACVVTGFNDCRSYGLQTPVHNGNVAVGVGFRCCGLEAPRAL
jgi:hypothetical protein